MNKDQSTEQSTTKGFGLANPASVHCQKLGGKIVIQNTQTGQIGFCHLPDGRIIEEWQLFRESMLNDEMSKGDKNQQTIEKR